MAKVIVATTDSELDSSVEMGDEEINNDDVSFPASKGLADSMAKILSSNVAGKKVPILAKAKSDKERMKMHKQPESKLEVKDENVVSFETAPKPQKNENDDDDDEDLLTAKERRERLLKKKLWEEMSHVQAPFNREEIEKSRKLKRIGTKGVVKLFNSVLQHQNMVNEKIKKVGRTESKREKVLNSLSKGQFLDSLKDKNKKNETDDQVDPIKVEIKEEPMDDDGPSWDVLRDEYLMNPEMKDWDKDDSDEDDDDANDDADDSD